MIMVNELGLQDMTVAICHLFPKYGVIFASLRVTETIAIVKLMIIFAKDINAHAIAKIMLITKLQMRVLAHSSS